MSATVECKCLQCAKPFTARVQSENEDQRMYEDSRHD